MKAHDISAAVKRAIAGNYRQYASKFGPKSLDEAITNDGNLTRLDRLGALGMDEDDQRDGAAATWRQIGRVNSAIEPCSILYDVTRARIMAEDGQGWRSSLDLRPDQVARL